MAITKTKTVTKIFFINKTLPGFQIKIFGSSSRASEFAGFNKNKITFYVLLASGGLSGVAGVIEVSANMGRLQPEVSFGYGFTAIIVAFLGRLNPYGVVIAGIIIATAKLGADNAQMVLGIPKVVTGIFEGMLLFFLLAGETIQKYKISSPNVAISIPVTSAIIRVVTAPLMNDEELGKAIETKINL